ncbi:MAG: hypothetical protein ACI8UR_001991 [Natronomonas sp.]|jgi:hypothetical protein|uniref:hypothetical protein n=1 Tax=Natronomonas sp. TaxID=2184060 RepID=UPI00398A0FD6
MRSSTSTNDRGLLPAAASSLLGPLKAGAFWAAVLLPLCTVALLATGVETTADYLTLVGFVVANVIALVVGHDYGQ